MVRQLIWFLLGWDGLIPLRSYSTAEYLIACGGVVVALALYPVLFRLCFWISQRGQTARVGVWVTVVTCALTWYLLVLDLFLFNTALIAFPFLFVTLTGVTLYLFFNRV